MFPLKHLARKELTLVQLMAVRQQAVIWANVHVEPDLSRHMVSLELKGEQQSFSFI